VKIKIRRDDASVLEMNDWFAELRDDGHAEPADDGHVEPADDGHVEPARDDGPEPESAAVASPAYRPTASVRATARVAASASAAMPGRAVIGDQLRIPIAWCEMGSCISHHADRAALGEADIRARAISADWRIDALGRLACPRCQQSGVGFRASHPVALWDRDAAITRALLATAVLRAGVRQEC
jgi:hypothetical protein